MESFMGSEIIGDRADYGVMSRKSFEEWLGGAV
jgi:hypothetical protein